MTILPSASAHVKSCDRPEEQSSFNVIIFKLQTLSCNGWGSRDLFGGGTPGSRACIFLSYLRSQLCSKLSSLCCKVFLLELSKTFRIAFKLHKSVFNFFPSSKRTENCGNVFSFMLIFNLSNLFDYLEKNNVSC